MRFCLYSLTLRLLLSTCTYAQTPHLSGDVYISLKDGQIRADLTVSKLPPTAQYTIWLNKGLDVADFRDGAGKQVLRTQKKYDKDQAYESNQYWFPAKNEADRSLPDQFRVRYAGTFPVLADSAKRPEMGDWKGNIAFNGKTLRAAEQTAWYPVLHDAAQDKLYQDVTFDLTIHCPDAKTIYLNGCPPQPGPTAQFRSDRPFPLLLFVGDYAFKKERNTYLLNTTLSTPQAEVLDGWLSRIKAYYEKQLQRPYGVDITLLATTPISRRNDWLFVTYHVDLHGDLRPNQAKRLARCHVPHHRVGESE